MIGAPERLRTSDLRHTKAALCQLSYKGDARAEVARAVKLEESVGFEPTGPLRSRLLSRKVP